ncbi:MAG: dehypoxanthine futalosine cyclase [Bacteroidales bacterium]|jgi:cyclic dehypoxanthinyl futalosine synthase|nr:dehypoxanthine futalosine cyclase [Bacteroidales bacterium]
MNLPDLYHKALDLQFLSVAEGLFLYRRAPLAELMQLGSRLRQIHIPGDAASWQIDRNVNYTNVCVSHCRFCNFCRTRNSADAYITTDEEYDAKIGELFAIGGDQLLLQGGMHPDLGLPFYDDLFRKLKKRYPGLKLHALGPPEVHHIAGKEGMSYRETLEALVEAGLDSLPGAGAEILSDRVRRMVSPGKCTTQQWLDVMREAHAMNLPTSATMMFGHVETERERIEHLIHIRDLQAQKPEGAHGFLAFISWPFQSAGTVLERNMSIRTQDHLRMIAVSRVMLPNVTNIQASWLTAGIPAGLLALYAGANDLGSVMMEENVVSAAGAKHQTDVAGMREAIRKAGFTPILRNQKYEHLSC